jgi:tRNA-dihydrouridine synthase
MVKIGNIELPSFPLLLAPMEDVSDPPFRALCKEQGADVVYTEFISSEGLIRNAAKSTKKLDIYTKERPGWDTDFWIKLRLNAWRCRHS